MPDPIDTAQINIPWSRRRGPSLDSQIDAWKREQARQARIDRKAEHAARIAAREAEKARPKLTAADCKGARFVRNQNGWHEVVRVSAKSVTVKTAWSWTDRIPMDRVLEVRK